jgi:hypothetical protein
MFARAQGRALIHGGVRVGLVPAAALAVHQLRFVLAFGGSTGRELALQGHSYFHSLVPWIVLSLAVAAGGFIRAVGRAMAGQRSASRYALSLTGLWLLCSGCLLAIYVTQECLEGVVLSGHPAGLAGIFGYGGWWSIPAALCVGLVLAAIFHGARWALDEVARRSTAAVTRRPPHALAPAHPVDAVLPRLAPLAAGRSGRGPPR